MLPLIQVDHVSYQYPQNPVLKDVSFHVDKHEFVSLLGSSGVGKTTIFNLIAGILPLQEGRILISGSEDIAGKVSYMLQKDLLLEHKTVLANILLPLQLQKVPKKDALAEAEAVLSDFGLSAYRNYYPAELSGGMRQRIALIRTYLFRQKIFLLDEAFSALDAMTKLQLHRWYKKIMAEYGLTTLLITHDIEEALLLSDRIYLIKGKPGRIVAEIPVDLESAEIPIEIKSDDRDRDARLLAYKRQILEILDLEASDSSDQ